MTTECSNLSNYVLMLRRYFHQYPELSLKETNTCKKIATELSALQIPYRIVHQTGIVAEIKNGPGKTVLLRADIDALPITEQTHCAYTSKNKGIMHACGHDSHIAMLLGAAKIIMDSREKFSGTIRLVFQPAEETGQASASMIAEGLLDNVDTVFSLHVEPSIPSGYFSLQAGPIMAGVDDFKIQIQSMGGHGAYPHLGSDAVLAISHLVVNLQEFVSREMPPLEPVVLTVGTLHAGTKTNILANDATLTGNIRFFNPKLSHSFSDILNRIATHTADMFKSTATLTYTPSLLPVENDSYCTQIALSATELLFGVNHRVPLEVSTASDDFSRYASKCPGVYLFLGSSDGTCSTSYPLHNEHFNIDESILVKGSQLYAAYAYNYLKEI